MYLVSGGDGGGLGYDILDGYFVGRGLKFKTELWPLIMRVLFLLVIKRING